MSQIENPRSTRKIIWGNILFFALTTLLAFVGGPIYIWKNGISASEVALFLFYSAMTGMSITVGYHRLFAHRTFRASKIVDFIILFFGAAAFEQSALDWSSQHRDHHRFVDTDKDPYNIKKGFFYAHIGWLIFWRHTIDYDNAKDLRENKLLMHQHNHYHLWAIGSGILLPLAIGAMTGHILGALLFAIGARLTFVYHSTFCINSVCHKFGKATYDIYSTAKDHWFVAFLTNGEGYHNFHHRFPNDYRNGVRWYQWDPSKWTIALLARLGLAQDLRRVSRFAILEARLAAEHQTAHDFLKAEHLRHELEKIRETLKVRYEHLSQTLAHWETITRKYQHVIKVKTDPVRELAVKELAEARARFDHAYQEWNLLLKERFVGMKPSPA